jgi:zinc transporter ZupT
MEKVSLLPWIFLTLLTSLLPALVAHKFSAWWRRHGDIGEVVGTSVVAVTALFTVALPIMSEGHSLSFGLLALFVGVLAAFAAHHFFEDEGEERKQKIWFVALTFALHNFPEGVANGRAILEAHGSNLFTWSLLVHNIFDAIVMTLAMLAMGIGSWRLVFVLCFAGMGEVLGILLAGTQMIALDWISLLSVGAIWGLAIDAFMHWNRDQWRMSLFIFLLLSILFNFNHLA